MANNHHSWHVKDLRRFMQDKKIMEDIFSPNLTGSYTMRSSKMSRINTYSKIHDFLGDMIIIISKHTKETEDLISCISHSKKDIKEFRTKREIELIDHIEEELKRFTVEMESLQYP